MLKLPSPLQKIENELTRKFNVQLFIKRDDLIHQEISGNKWRKLKYNIKQAAYENKKTILTFGGAFSNHITATAKACAVFGFKSIGIIRGEEYFPLNKSLQFAKDCGMQLFYLDRENYKSKNIASFLSQSLFAENDIYFLPEGGANELAVKGCAEIVDEIHTQLAEDNNKNFDFICCACGTGTTLTGIASNLKSHQQAIGIAVLKYDKLQEEILQNNPNLSSSISIFNYPFGGYAKTSPQLIQFIKEFYTAHHILLDYVYTGKMMFGVFDLLSKNYFPKNSTIVVVHTGGVMNANVFELTF